MGAAGFVTLVGHFTGSDLTGWRIMVGPSVIVLPQAGFGSSAG
jgi:hypothetical protein